MGHQRYEVTLPGFVKSFQSPRHNGSLVSCQCPTQAKRRLEWATRLVIGKKRCSRTAQWFNFLSFFIYGTASYHDLR